MLLTFTISNVIFKIFRLILRYIARNDIVINNNTMDLCTMLCDSKCCLVNYFNILITTCDITSILNNIIILMYFITHANCEFAICFRQNIFKRIVFSANIKANY